MSDKSTGGPAFPELYVSSPEPGDYRTMAEGGMTLRDYFAAKALQGLLAEPTEPGGTWFAHALTPSFTSNTETLKGERVAAAAYLLADAMLKTRGN